MLKRIFKTTHVVIYPNGNKYIGEMKDGRYDGKGKFNWNDGDMYEGEYKDGVRDGKGKMVYYNNNFSKYILPIKYEGDFNNGSINGFGTMTYNTKGVYRGYFMYSKRNGF